MSEVEVIKREFQKDVDAFVDGEVFSRGAIVGVLKKHCRNDSEYRQVLKALTGKTTSKQLTPAEWYALLKFVKPFKPEGGKWGSERGEDLNRMCNALVRSLDEAPEQTTFLA